MTRLRAQALLARNACLGAVGIWLLAALLRPASDIGREITLALMR